MKWTRRLMSILHWHTRAARHADRSPAKRARERAEVAVQEAQVRRIKAEVVTGSLERRVFGENHISEGIARLWVGRPG